MQNLLLHDGTPIDMVVSLCATAKLLAGGSWGKNARLEYNCSVIINKQVTHVPNEPDNPCAKLS